MNTGNQRIKTDPQLNRRITSRRNKLNRNFEPSSFEVDNSPIHHSMITGQANSYRNIKPSPHKSYVFGKRKGRGRGIKTGNNSLHRKKIEKEFGRPRDLVPLSDQKTRKKGGRLGKQRKESIKSLRYKDKDVDIYQFKKAYKSMTNDYPNLETINFKNNVIKGNLANIIHDVVPKRRPKKLTLDLTGNVFQNMDEWDLEKFRDICKAKNIYLVL